MEEQIKDFAKMISEKVYDNFKEKYSTVNDVSDSIYNMLIHHMNKQGWKK